MWVPRSPARMQETRRAAAYHAPATRRAGKTRRSAGFFGQSLSYSGAIGMGAHPHDSTAGPAGGRLGADLSAHVEAIVHAAEREARAAEQAIAAHRRSAEEEVRRYLSAARLHVDAESAARAARIETLSAAAHRLADDLADAVAALARELHAGEQAVAARLPRVPWPVPPATPAPSATPAPPAASAAPAPPAAPAPSAAAPSVPAPSPTAPSPPADDAPHPSWSRTMPPAPAEPAPEAPASTAAAAAAPARAAANGARDTDGDAQPAVPSAARLVAIEMAVGGSSRAEVEQHLRLGLGVAEPEPLLDDVFGVASHAGSRLAWGEP